MRIFKNTWFTRFADKEGITDDELRELVDRLEAGNPDANLGGGVFKMRLARPGEGKAGGYRAIVFFKSEERTFFEYCYTKANKSNISEKELRFFKETAKEYLSMPTNKLRGRIEKGKFIEL